MRSRRIAPLILVAIAGCVLAGCHSSALGPPHDVAYYETHVAERTAVLAKCKDNPGKYQLEQNCTNAAKALWDSSMTKPDRPPSMPVLVGKPPKSSK